MSNDPRFKTGDGVRVRAGIKDPDNPDLPISNWCGLIEEVDLRDIPPAYLIRWNQRTRDNMPPVFVRRCNHEDLEVESMWLDELDLEPDDGANLPIEQPPELPSIPLNDENQEDRIRAVFGLRSDDEIPEVDEGSLRIYHAHLLTRLVFPFDGRWVQDEGPQQLRGISVKVMNLLPPDEIDPEDGILCEVQTTDKSGTLPLVDIERDEGTPQGRLVADYGFWMDEWGFESEDVGNVLPFPIAPPGMEGMLPAPPRIPMGKMLNITSIFGAIVGSTVGAIYATIESAPLGMLIGSCILAGMFGMVGRRYGTIISAMVQMPRASIVGMLLGVLIGGLFGTVLGAMAVAALGTIGGSIVGSLLGEVILPKGRKGRGKFLLGFFGACIGGIILTFTIDRELAAGGMVVGALIGAVGMVIIVLVAILTLASLMRRRGG